MHPNAAGPQAPTPSNTNGAFSFSESAENPLLCLELFAGPGGLALGTQKAGFKHIALIEFESSAAETLRTNCKGPLHLDPEVVLEQDARDIDYEPYAGKVDLLAAGPPCQPFSRGGGGLGAKDSRNMFPALMDAVAVIKPRAILIENVKGLISGKFESYFQYILRRLQFPLHAPRTKESWDEHFQRLTSLRETDFPDTEQYVVWYQLVDAADYGVPQRRHRVLILAFRRDLNLDRFELRRTHSRLALLHDQWVSKSYGQRHGIELSDYVEPGDEHLVKRMRNTLFSPDGLLPWQTVRDAIGDLPRPVARGETAVIANHVQHPGARSYPGHVGSKLDYPAKALKAGAHGTPGGENMVQVPGQGVRYFTTREAARLQTFPDNWTFHGVWGACIRQLGNAVPIELATMFAKEIHKQLRSLPPTANVSIDHHGVSFSSRRSTSAILSRE